MDKCWFVLRQTHYPPPEIQYIDGGKAKQSGAICLGDIITSLDTLDLRLNEDGPEPLPLDIPIYHTSSSNFRWNDNESRAPELQASLTAPTAALLGVDISAEIGVALKRSTEKYSLIEALDCMIIQPRRAYIESALANADVTRWISKKTNWVGWKLYMVTGMIIAKGSKSQGTVESREVSLSGGPNVLLANTLQATLAGSNSTAHSKSRYAESLSDYVWALRFIKISQGLLDSVWHPSAHRTGAVFDAAETGIDVDAIISQEGLENMTVVHGQRGGKFIVQNH